METVFLRSRVQSDASTCWWYGMVLGLLIILNGPLCYSTSPTLTTTIKNLESQDIVSEASLQTTTARLSTEKSSSDEGDDTTLEIKQNSELTLSVTETSKQITTEQPTNEPLSAGPKSQVTDATVGAQNASITEYPFTSARNTTSPVLPPKTSKANVTVHNVTHKSAMIFWEILNEKDDNSYRLVGYKLTPLTMDVEDKITDIFVNASMETRSRLLQENLLHNTRYMFCVLPMMMADMGNGTYGDVSNGFNVLNTTDCNSFKTPYNPLNIEAVIALCCAVFILAVFFCTALTSQFYEKTVEEEKEERKQLVDQLIQSKRQRRKHDYGSDKLRLSSHYKIVNDDMTDGVSESETSELQSDAQHDIELDKIDIQDDSSDTGYLLGDMK